MEFFIRHKTVIAFVGFILFCIISLSLQSGGSNSFTFSFEGVGSAMLRPFQRGYNSIAGGLNHVFSGFSFSALSKARKELKEAHKKLRTMGSMAVELHLLRSENEKLRQLLELKKTLTFPVVAAEIISKDPSNWYRTIVVDKGYNDGIKINMPVIGYIGNKQAVVGKIVEVRSSVSRVVPIISPRLRVGVKIEKTKYPGLLFGYAINSDKCIMDYISREAQVKKQSLVVTSGQGGVFPKGIPVGNIIKSRILEAGAYQKAIVVPIINFNSLEKVFIIKKDTDKALSTMIKEKS